MKRIIIRVIRSRNVKKISVFLKQNKKVILLFLIGTIFVDTFFIKMVSDVVTFGVLLLYCISAMLYRLKSKETFLLCLGLVAALFVSFLLSGTSVSTEKVAVWLVLFMAVGVYSQWRE